MKKNEMQVLMESWRRYLIEGDEKSSVQDVKNSEHVEDELDEGHEDPDETQPDHEGDGSNGKRWDTP